MPPCPNCSTVIWKLHCSQEGKVFTDFTVNRRGEAEYSNKEVTSMGSPAYFCPVCGHVLFYDEEDAHDFLRREPHHYRITLSIEEAHLHGDEVDYGVQTEESEIALAGSLEKAQEKFEKIKTVLKGEAPLLQGQLHPLAMAIAYGVKECNHADEGVEQTTRRLIASELVHSMNRHGLLTNEQTEEVVELVTRFINHREESNTTKS